MTTTETDTARAIARVLELAESELESLEELGKEDEDTFSTHLGASRDFHDVRDLIAASPELADVCADLLRDLEESHSFEVENDHHGDDASECTYCDTIARAKAALAKAGKAEA